MDHLISNSKLLQTLTKYLKRIVVKDEIRAMHCVKGSLKNLKHLCFACGKTLGHKE